MGDRRVIDPSLLQLNCNDYLMYVTVDSGANEVWMTEMASPTKPVGPKVQLIVPDRPRLPVRSKNGIYSTGRAIRAQKFTWNPDGTPNFGIPANDDPIQLALTPGAPSFSQRHRERVES